MRIVPHLLSMSVGTKTLRSFSFKCPWKVNSIFWSTALSSKFAFTYLKKLNGMLFSSIPCTFNWLFLSETLAHRSDLKAGICLPSFFMSIFMTVYILAWITSSARSSSGVFWRLIMTNFPPFSIIFFRIYFVGSTLKLEPRHIMRFVYIAEDIAPLRVLKFNFSP